MILADKIIHHRKLLNLTQEELAEKMNVSRQSISKWEGALSIPDMNKIVLLSEVFGVSIDYLMKDDIQLDEPVEDTSSKRVISLQEANSFLDKNDRSSKLIATAVSICILSPVLLIFLTTNNALSLQDDLVLKSSALGLIVLIPMVAFAVGLFIKSSLLMKDSEYLNTEVFELAYGVESIIKKRQASYQDTHSKRLIFGVMILILSVIPIFVSELLLEGENLTYVSVPLLLILVSFGVNLLVRTSCINGGFDKLLQVNEYSLKQKKDNELIEKIAAIYWPFVVAIYLLFSFTTNRWGDSWIIWPVAGVGFAVVAGIISLFTRE